VYDAYAERLLECDQQLEKMLEDLARYDLKADKSKRRRGKARNAPKFDARTLLLQMCGVDLTRIDGIDVTTAFKVLAEVGADLSRFKDAKHFASWLWGYVLEQKLPVVKLFRQPPNRQPTVLHKPSKWPRSIYAIVNRL
jgi:hypothetical protein